MKTSTKIIGILALLINFSACDTDGSTTGIMPDSGTDNAKPDGGDAKPDAGPTQAGGLHDLTETERIDLCKTHRMLLTDSEANSVACYADAISFPSEEDPCQTQVDACLQNPPPRPLCDAEKLPDCASQVTLEEFKTCKEAEAALIKALAATASCDTEPEQFDAIFTIPSCLEIADKCPGVLFEDSDPGEGE